MRILADTHVLLWWLADDAALPPRHREAISDGDNDVWFSAVSIAEIAVKASLGKLDVPPGAGDALRDCGFQELALRAAHAEALRDLPWHHRDPFDRILLCQAQVEGLVIASVDERFPAYGIPLL